MPNIDPGGISPNSRILVSCEGGAECFIFEKLLDEGRLIICRENIIAITRDRSPKKIQDDYLNFDYGEIQPIILRILDSPKEKFVLGNLYRDRFPVCSVFTRPEVEILIIINENKYDDFSKKKSSMKPSLYCKQVLNMGNVKRLSFLKAYWRTETLVESIRLYRQIHHGGSSEHCFADLLKPPLR